MTSATQPADEPYGPSRTVQWIAHRPALTFFLFLTYTGIRLFVHTLELNAWIPAFLNVLFCGFIIFSIFVDHRHGRGICDACLNRPLGGPVTAEKKIKFLQLYHYRVAHPLKMIGFLFLVFGIFFFVSSFGIWAESAFGVVMWSIFMTFDRSTYLHEWLIPWCPWCKDDGFWTEGSPTPDPAGTKQHTH